MDLRGKLLYDHRQGDSYYFRYVTMSAEVFDVNVLQWILDKAVDFYFNVERWGNVLTDSITGLLTGYVAASSQSILDNIPETIDRGITVQTVEYLLFGDNEYFELPDNVRLAYVGATPTAFLGVLPSMFDLSVLCLEGVVVVYKKVLSMPDVTPLNPGIFDAINTYGSRYSCYIPKANPSIMQGRTSRIILATWNFDNPPYTSSMLAMGAKGLMPVNSIDRGSYFHQDSTLSYQGSLDGMFFSDAGYDSSVPYSAVEPPDSKLYSYGWSRVWYAIHTTVEYSYDFFAFAPVGYSGQGFVVKPKPALVPGGICGGGGGVVEAAILGISVASAFFPGVRING
jgi:hypothetical protein